MNFSEKPGPAGGEQGAEQEPAPEDQGRQPQGRVASEPAGDLAEEYRAPVGEPEPLAPVDRVVRPTDQPVKVSHGVAGHVVRLGEHQVGAGGAVEFAQAEDLGGIGTPQGFAVELGQEVIQLAPGRFSLRQPVGDPHDPVTPRGRRDGRPRRARHRTWRRPARRTGREAGGPAARPSPRGAER